MHHMYTLTVTHAQYVYSKRLHSANGYETGAAHRHQLWPAVILFEKQMKSCFSV
jgi:hypothetical protein